MSSAAHRECLRFSRQLEQHVAEARVSGDRPAHAQACQNCARRLQAALALVVPLGQRPAIPAQLAEPAFLESIHERVLAAFAAEPLGASVRTALRSGVQSASLPWPLQDSEAAIDGALREGARRAPSWLWARVRDRVRQMTGRSRWNALRRAGLIAASIGLFALLGWKLGRTDGTSTGFQVVFVPITEMPSVLHPASVLRQGGYR